MITVSSQTSADSLQQIVQRCLERVGAITDQQAWKVAQTVAHNQPQPADSPWTYDSQDNGSFQFPLKTASQHAQALPHSISPGFSQPVTQPGFGKHLTDIVKAAGRNVLYIITGDNDGDQQPCLQPSAPTPGDPAFPDGAVQLSEAAS